MQEYKKQLEILQFGAVEIVPQNEFEIMLKKSIDTNIGLRVKCGIDPTSANVHLGHLVPYRKMRQFQDLGHIGVVIIGDYTASIGDPTGRNEARPSLDKASVKKNAETYMEQLFTVLDKNKTEIRYQSEWFEKITLVDVIKWASHTTVAKLLGHETFSKRLENGGVLSLHEMFYPVLQGIDSVYIKADVELGGTDQKFNVLMGRDYQKAFNMRPQVAMLLPIVTGVCGTQKMSKSLGNAIGITDEPFDKFGKIMSIPDRLMPEYYQYIANVSQEKLKEITVGLKDGSIHPNQAKKDLAKMIVSFFHGTETGNMMLEKFESVFKRHEVPDDVMEYQYTRGNDLVSTLVEAKILDSKGEARRLIVQNAVSIDGEKISVVDLKLDDTYVGKTIKVGKRKFLKLK